MGIDAEALRQVSTGRLQIDSGEQKMGLFLRPPNVVIIRELRPGALKTVLMQAPLQVLLHLVGRF